MSSARRSCARNRPDRLANPAVEDEVDRLRRARRQPFGGLQFLESLLEPSAAYGCSWTSGLGKRIVTCDYDEDSCAVSCTSVGNRDFSGSFSLRGTRR
jgi:hypothetical protein